MATFTTTALEPVPFFVVASRAESARDGFLFRRSAFNASEMPVLAPCLLRMKLAVIDGIGKLKILNSIVGFYLVLVMNVFLGSQFTSQMPFHNESMLKDVCSLVPNEDVSLLVNLTASIPCSVVFASKSTFRDSILCRTFSRATVSRVWLDSCFANTKLFATDRARQRYAASRLLEFLRTKAAATIADPVAQVATVNESFLSTLAATHPMGACWRWLQEAQDRQTAKHFACQVNESRHGYFSCLLFVPQVLYAQKGERQ